MNIRIGFGYDIHRLVENRKLILGGVNIENPLGLLGHSDADVLTHSVIDSLLGVIKTYNSRYLDIFITITKGYQVLEEKVKSLLSKTLSRGRVDVKIKIADTSEGVLAFEVDEAKAEAYSEAMHALKNLLNIPGELPLQWILARDDLIKPKERQINVENVWQVVKECILEALADLDDMRSNEGAYIDRDFRYRLDLIAKYMDRIESESQGLLRIYQERLKQRITLLIDDRVILDDGRIEQEAAIMADKSDIAEEIIRVRSHLVQFGSIMDNDGPCGQKLNFLLQELNREINTIGSKTGKTAISHCVVDVKSELEKLREQVQNIE